MFKKLRTIILLTIQPFFSNRVLLLILLFEHNHTFSYCFILGHRGSGVYPGNIGPEAGMHPGWDTSPPLGFRVKKMIFANVLSDFIFHTRVH